MSRAPFSSPAAAAALLAFTLAALLVACRDDGRDAGRAVRPTAEVGTAGSPELRQALAGYWEVIEFEQGASTTFSCFRNDGAVEFFEDGRWTGYQRDLHTYEGTYRFLSDGRIRLVSGVTAEYRMTMTMSGDELQLATDDGLYLNLRRSTH